MRERVMYYIISCLLDIWTLPLYPPIPGFCLFVCFLFFDVAGFFVCLDLIEHVQRFKLQVGCSLRDSAL